jgi:hypothetical protein
MPRFPYFSSLPLVSGVSVETAGFNEGSTTLTQVTTGSSTYTFGSWTQLLASTTNKAVVLIIVVDASSSARFRIQIGVGASGSESAICEMTYMASSTSGKPSDYAAYLVNIPAGSRISACAAAVTASQNIYVGCYLVEVPA